MTHLEAELQQLKEAMIDMMTLVKGQLEKSRESILNKDVDLAQEIIHNEIRVNANELSIDRDCENIFALFSPVAVDLRFVLAALKINTHLERIGDHADGIARYVIDIDLPSDEKLLKDIRFHEMFETSLSMLQDSVNAYESEDTSMARKVFKKDVILNEINKSSSKVIAEYSKNNPDNINKYLFLFSILKKLERVGDLSKNVAEEVIFYLEAKVLKHKKLKKNK